MRSTNPAAQQTPAHNYDFLSGGGELGALMREKDWSQTPLGPISSWPQSLRTAVSICLNSDFPIVLWWGRDLTLLYNDNYRGNLNRKHPAALGKPGREVWAEIWDVIGPMLHHVLEKGEATNGENLRLMLESNGYPEERYFTFSYSPIYDETGGVGGVFTPVQEPTERVIGERRLRTLRDLAARSLDIRDVDDVCHIAADTLAANPYDIPFACLYLLGATGEHATLCGTAGIEPGHPLAPETLTRQTLTGPPPIWPVFAATDRAIPVSLRELPPTAAPPPTGAWQIPPQEVKILPLLLPGHPTHAGALVAALSPHKRLDEDYRAFLALVAAQVSSAITDALTYEAEKRRAEALAELDRAKTTFFSNVSHEFRTPLTLMLGPMEDALAAPSHALAGDNLETVHRNALRLLKLVNTLLDFSRIEAGRIQAQYQPTDLSAYTTDLASEFRAAIEAAGMRLRVHCAALPQLVYVDRTMWEKIVLNLLSNAFKFTAAGEIEVALRADGPNVELRIRDTGTGIPPEHLPHIFERFHRVEGAAARTFEGTGIGLALVQELVRLHGGTIDVESALGVGTTFTVTVPFGTAHLPAEQVLASGTPAFASTNAAAYLAEAQQWNAPDTGGSPTPDTQHPTPNTQHLTPNTQHPTPDTPRPRILLADDNADMRGYLERLLAPTYDLVAVSDGEAALQSIRQRRPNLVLSDVMMPRLDGFQLLHTLRNDPQTADIPVILLSARAGAEARIEGLDAGADDYLTKPFTAKELLARIATHLELARIRRDAAARIAMSEERFRVAMLHAPLVVCTYDRDLRYTWIANPTHPYTPQELLGRRDDELLPPEDARKLMAFKQAVLETGQGMRQDMTLRVQGRMMYYDITSEPLRDDTGAIVGAIVAAVDLTERKQAELALRKSEERFRLAAEMITDIVWTVAADGRVTSPMPAWEAFTGVPFDEYKDFGWVNAIHPDDRLAAQQAWEQSVATRTPVRQENRLRRHDGQWRLCIVRAAPLFNPDGSVREWVGAHQDVTEQRQALAEIQALNARLRRAMTETHHRVKNNLQYISALIDMYDPADGGTVPLSEFMRLGSNVRALGVVHDVLTQSAKNEDRHETLSAQRVLEGLLSALREAAGGDKLRFASEEIEVTSAQATALALLTNELVANAQKHGRGQVRVNLHRAGANAVLEVCDNGPGFPPDFDPALAANTGLELVQNVVRWDLRGGVVYENGADGGGCVRVTFPVTLLPPVGLT